MRLRKIAISLLAAVVLPFAASAVIPEKPVPERLVNDFAQVFTPSYRDSLERALVAFDDSTSNQILVVTVADLDGYAVSEYALRLANRWGVGSSRNNGLVVLLKPRGIDGYVDVTIQVGRGLEGAIPDVYASRIIRNIMGPHLSRNEYMPAVSKACAELQSLASGEISEPRDGDDDDEAIAAILAFLFIVFMIIIVLAVVEDRNKKGGGGHGFGGGPRGPIIISGGSPFLGGSSFGGGSFGGGFGGFGGGSFGGGGASGRF